MSAQPYTTARRMEDLADLSAGLGHTLPPLHTIVRSYVVVLEESQDFLVGGMQCVATMAFGPAAIAVVGTSAPLGADMRHVLCSAPGSDTPKMTQVAEWLKSGQLAGPVVLVVPPHRAWLLNGLLQRALQVRGINCRTQAMDTPQENGVDAEDAIRQAGFVLRAIKAGEIDPIPEFEPGTELRLAYERLTA